MKRKLLLIAAMIAGTTFSHAQTWSIQNINYLTDVAYPFDISIPSPDVAWTVAFSGSDTSLKLQEFSKTIDGGQTWVSGTVTSNTSMQFSSVHGIDANTAYAMMFNGVLKKGGGIWKTTDGGANWNQISVGQIFDANSFPDFVYFWNAATGIAVGDQNGGYYEIYTTADSGNTWTRVPQANIPAGTVSEAAIINNYDVLGDAIWFGTTKGRVFRSLDKGQNWTVATVPGASTRAISDVSFNHSGKGICTSTASSGTGTPIIMYLSSDSGATWATFNPTGRVFRTEFASIPETDIFLSCSASSSYGRGSSYSTDNGHTWTLIDTIGSGTDQGYTTLEFLDINTGYAGGFYQGTIFSDGIYKWDAGILNTSTVAPRAELSTYPNPTTGVINLNFKAKNSDVMIRVVDAMGRVVYSDVIRSISGKFTKTFDFSSLAKGVYTVVADSGIDHTQEKIVIQ